MKIELKALVVDDEKPARDELIYMLNNTEYFKEILSATNGEEALQKVMTVQPDVVFLDIEMPKLDGFEAAKSIINMAVNPAIVFVTAYDQYAIEAFDINAVDYLLKPFTHKRLLKTVSRLIDNIEKEKTGIESKLQDVFKSLNKKKISKIPVNSKKGRIKLLDPQEIIYAYSEKGQVYIKTEDCKFGVNFSLKKLENLLGDRFFRCHRSYLVNFEIIREIIPWFKGKYRLILATDGEIELPVGRTKVKELKKRLNL